MQNFEDTLQNPKRGKVMENPEQCGILIQNKISLTFDDEQELMDEDWLGSQPRKPEFIYVIQATSAGFEAGNAAQIMVNGVAIETGKNEHGHTRGLHVVVINPLGKTDNAIFMRETVAQVFDTYRTSDYLEEFIDGF